MIGEMVGIDLSLAMSINMYVASLWSMPSTATPRRRPAGGVPVSISRASSAEPTD